MAQPTVAEDSSTKAPRGDRDIINTILAFRHEAHNARTRRIALNERNRRAYENTQDWGHKIQGQSKEFLPKTAETVDQFGAFIKRALIQFGDWFSIEAKNTPISEDSVRELLKAYLMALPEGENTCLPFSTKVSDGVRDALLETTMIFKIHGYPVLKRDYVAGGGEDEDLEIRESRQWRLQIDLLPFHDYYKDPTGRGLYELHSVERDFHDVKRLAEAGIYDLSVVRSIQEDFRKQQDERRPEEKDRNPNYDPYHRKRVTITEFWGTLLDADGEIIGEKVFCAVANDKYLIRKPEPFPFWHGESPFVEIPIMRLSHTVFHKALYDDVVPINLALNELFNLMLDGGLASVWGVKQVRADMLEDPTQISNGIAQGMSLSIKEEVPEGMKVVEQVVTGDVPAEAMGMYQVLDREFNASAKTSDLKMGLLPPRQVKATEVVEASQSQAVVLDSLIGEMERKLEQVLWKAMTTILQFADNIDVGDLINTMSQDDLITFIQMTPAQRFAQFTKRTSIRVFGLSATLARARDFQRILAIVQVASQNPLLLPAFVRQVNPDKLLERLWKITNLNADDFRRKPEDIQDLAADMQIWQMFQQVEQSIAQGGGQGVLNTDASGEPGIPAETNAEATGNGGNL
jgi:hypothetical protein